MTDADADELRQRREPGEQPTAAQPRPRRAMQRRQRPGVAFRRELGPGGQAR
jgi:hypothetical protein